MKADLRASQVSVLEWNHESFNTADIVIPVDNTITELSIGVGSKGSGGSPKAYTSLIDPFGTYYISAAYRPNREYIHLLQTKQNTNRICTSSF